MYSTKVKRSYAKHLRRNQTPAERRMRLLWFFGFNAQVVTPSGYVADWYWPAGMLIVELDGSVHDKRADKKRDKHHRAKGIHTVRIKNQLTKWPYLPLAYFKVFLLAFLYEAWRVLKACRL